MPNDPQNRINELEKKVQALNDEFYRNNFTSTQDFNKTSRFNSRLRVPVVTALPATCEIGELCSYSAKLYHCSAANTWTAQT